MLWKSGKYTIDDNESFEGFDADQSWNGWAMPAFTFDVAQRVLATSFPAANWRYDATQDQFFWMFEDTDPDWSDYDAKGFDITINGVVVHVYPIGAGEWVWDRLDDPQPDQAQSK